MMGQTINGKPIDEVVVVDFGCPDKVSDWIESLGQQRVKSVRALTNTDEFNGSRARNIGVRHATGDYVALFDSDVTVTFGLIERFIAEMKFQNWDLCCVASNGNLNGQCVVKRKTWEKVRGFDEGMEGWGYDDIDFYKRIERAGIPWGSMENCRLSSIVHGDEASTRYHKQKDKLVAAAENGKRMQDFNRAINPEGYGDL
jgi:glycosyltransferase involved in cell wall biosynthesis